jgi:A/G-specific adenine glycosylase
MHKLFQQNLLTWYEENKRKLPWRNTRNAYYIWLSEIIMQQTRIEQGTKYYLKFVDNYPEINDLAKASEQEVLNLWQGLGYYSRARNLHKTAKTICRDYNGEFPKTYNEIAKLPGIGPYTAAAISSFAFQIPKAVVDGNVYRFLSRYFGVRTPIDSNEGKKEFQNLADLLLPKDKNDDHNQAIMEFGATICTYKKTKCDICPFSNTCIANKDGLIDILPVKSKKTKVTVRQIKYHLIQTEEKILFRQKTEKDIWQNMYELPKSIDNNYELSSELKLFLSKPSVNKESYILKDHLLSHQRLKISIDKSKLENPCSPPTKHLWIEKSEIKNYPLPKPIAQFLNDQGIEVQD